MTFGAARLAHIPATAIMIFLVGLLLWMRRRYPRLATGTWLVATSFFVVPEVGWFFADAGGPLRSAIVHSLILLGQMLGGVSLLFYEGAGGVGKRLNRRWVLVNTAAPVVMVLLYGCYVVTPVAYVGVAVAGVVVLAVSARWRGVGMGLTLAGIAVLVPAAAWSACGGRRMGTYWILAMVYGYGFLHLRRALPRRSIGRVPILVSLAIWVVLFLTHAWAIEHAYWRDFADAVWVFEKYLLAFGMLIALLEDQVDVNEHLALHDALTGLPNRRSLLEWLDAAIERARRVDGQVTLFLVDLNGFKQVNDTLGHQAGDQLLVVLARRMREVVEGDDLLVRLGGDEFVLASARCAGDADARRIEDAMQRAIGEPVDVAGERVVVGGSFGVAVFPEDTVGVAGDGVRSMLLKVADQRMYARKVRG